MTFDDWMLGISECHKPGDDGVTLRMLRACWAEAQAVERERCAKVCDVTRESIFEFSDTAVKETGHNVCTNLAAAIRGN